MTFKRWDDAGVAWTVEVATTGALVLGGTPADIPVDSGGPGGVPLGWTQYVETFALASDANFTTAGGRFSVSNALPTNTNYSYGAELSIPVVVGRSYRINLSARTMEGKDAASFTISVNTYNATVPFPVGSSGVGILGFTTSSTDWERITIATGVIPSGVTRIVVQIRVKATFPPATSPKNWGMQFTDFVLADMTPDPTPIVWHDITCDVRAITTRNGRERFTSRYEVSTTSIELNNDLGEYSYRDPHPFNFRPGRQIRGTVTYDGIVYPMFYAIIDSIKDSYSLDGHAVTSISAFDPSSLLSTVNVPTVAKIVDLSGTRVGFLLDVVGYADRDVSAGVFIMQSIKASGRSIREEIGVTADSEGGYFFANRSGEMVYRDRTWPDWSTYQSTVTATILARTDDANLDVGIDGIPTMAGAPIICATELQTDWNASRIINYLELANAGGTAEVYEDEVSQRAYGIGTYSRTDYVNDITSSNANGYLATRAADLMDGYATPVLRVNSVSFRPDGPDDWVWTLSVFLNWLVRIWYAHPTNDWGYALATHVQSVEHRITVDDWLVTMAVDEPESFVDAPVVPQSHWDDGIATWDDGITVWS